MILMILIWRKKWIAKVSMNHNQVNLLQKSLKEKKFNYKNQYKLKEVHDKVWYQLDQ